MGSKNCPETPRQKMIGMMYLFLTAMLALNVSSAVLEGFVRVDQSLRKSKDNFKSRNSFIYNEFANQVSINPGKAEVWQNKALQVKVKADTMEKVIQDLKLLMAQRADGEGADPEKINKLDDLNAAPETMLDPINPRAKVLKNKIIDYKTFLISAIGDTTVNKKGAKVARSIEVSLNTNSTKGSTGKLWEDVLFGEMPVAASVALLSNLQNDVRNAESEVISYLYDQIDAADYKFTGLKAFVIPTSTYVLRGGEFSAQIILAAVDNTQEPTITVNGRNISADNKGDFWFKTTANSIGEQEIRGSIIALDGTGTPQKYEFMPLKYEVAEPNATVSATKMNVMYAGIDNPVSISVPGVSSTKVKPTISNGTLTALGGGNYIAKPSSIGTATINIEAEILGKTQKIGNGYIFKVKPTPPPMPFILVYKDVVDASGKTVKLPQKLAGGKISKRDLMESKGLVAELLDSDFDIEYKVTGFQVRTYDTNGNAQFIDASSGTWSEKQLTRMRSLDKDAIFYIAAIKAVGPDHLVKDLPVMEVIVK